MQRSIFTQFYTHNRTREILQGKGIKVKKIEKVSINKPSGEYLNCVHVVYVVENGTRCSMFVSCKEYLAKAYGERKERSKDYTAQQGISNPSNWTVVAKVIQLPVHGEMATRGSDGILRTVTTIPGAVTCSCEDFEHQPGFLKEHPYLWNTIMKEHHMCKHTFTVLSALGFNSLRDYFKAWQPGGRFTQLPTKVA